MRTTYSTGKIIIGKYYVPPQKNYMNSTDEFWQSVLTGDYQREVIFRRQMYLYIWCLALLFSTLAMVM